MSSQDSKKPKKSAVLSEMDKAIQRVKWLKSLAKELTQEANELETKWGLADSGDAMSLDASAGAAGGETGVSDAAGGKPAKAPEKEKSKKKKRKRAAEAEVDTTEAEAVQPDKPSASDQITEGQDVESPAVVKSKKSKKDKKRKKHVFENGAQDPSIDQPQKKKKNKDKYNNRKGKGKDVARNSDAAGKSPAASPAKTADNWNVSALEGGPKRQSKFMKLLGGGKAASSPAAKNSDEARSKKDFQKSQDDLAKQYDTGMRMKFEGQGQRRGLGA